MSLCRYCHEPAGWFKKTCTDCQSLLAKLAELPVSFSFRQLLDKLMETPASNDKIQRFLEADLDGQGSLRDFITARMTNELAVTVGQPATMDAQRVKQIREAEQKQPASVLKPGEIDPMRR